jgi:hypothetical protein
MKTTSAQDGLWGMLGDLTKEPVWKYEDSPPLLVAQLSELDLFEAGEAEIARAHWFWSRRPQLTFHESAAFLVLALCVLFSSVIVTVAWPGASMPERFAEMIILLFQLAVAFYLALQRLRFFRWRREYELSIDRLIRTIHPE